jgi:uncharacterized hydrophobic protein (TIGR00271 family)
VSRFHFRQLLADRGLTPEERRAVLEDLFVFGKKNQAAYLFRMAILLVLSTIIATAGLLSDSAAVVIGAMLVAPLMSPVMAAAGAVVMGWSGRFYGALWMVFVMGFGAMLLSSLITFASPELIFIPEQVLARTRPTYYDLIIALAAGSAGAYTITRKETSAIPGVAVAVALLPPLASAGILLTTGFHELTLRAMVLFFVNLIAMVLAGALTFMAVGVSPATNRRKSAVFARSQIFLFIALTVAICIPLWFYSEKVIFNAQYRAAKSEILQSWLKESELELIDVDILREGKTFYMSLEGPTPPVNIGALHDELIAAQPENGKVDFKIKYTWTQKVSGEWPQEAQSIREVAERADAGVAELTANSWVWSFTQYNANATARAERGERYTVSFTDNSKFEVTATCGTWKGNYSYRGESFDIEMHKNLLSGCRKDSILKIFLDDLDRARSAYIRDDKLIVTMAVNGGTIYFQRQ